MDKKDLLPQAFAVKDQPSEVVKIAKIIALGVFFTTVVTASVFFAVRQGSAATGAMQPCPIQPADDRKLMERDLKHVTDLKMADGQILQERFTYDHQSNLVMVQTPGNGSEEFPATFVIDYDRALVFAHVHEKNVCMVYSLREEFGQQVSKELSTTDDRQVIDVANAVLINESYVVAGEIPYGFVESSSGPTVDGMCAGRTTYWLDRVKENHAENHADNRREKRGGCYSVKRCTPPRCTTRNECPIV